MSVIIKGMAMPETCYECRFREEYSNGDLCVAHFNKITELDKRLDTCPLVEMPDHDAEEMWNSILERSEE